MNKVRRKKHNLDVYAQRWESYEGKKTGYTPACHNICVRGICKKSKMKCSHCKNRKLIPLDRNIIARHLAGKEVIGVYLMLPDDNCWFLAIDIDEGDWTRHHAKRWFRQCDRATVATQGAKQRKQCIY